MIKKHISVYIYIYKYIYITYEYYLILGGKKKSCHCDMDKPGGHEAKWNKPDTEGKKTQKACSRLYVEFKRINYIEVESRTGGTRGGQVEEMGRSKSTASVMQDEYVWVSSARHDDHS